MRRWTKCMLLSICVVFQLGLFLIPANAANFTEHANALHELELFAGTENGFQLERQPTRVEGLVMFIRLLGAEEEALYENYSHPFLDVPSWASAYVGYAYYHDLTSGITESSFGTNNQMGADEYITFLLRALGYDDSNGDFAWNTSIDKAIDINLLTPSEASNLRSQATNRGTIVELSWAALTQPFKDNPSTTLAHDLVNKGIFTQQQAIQYGLWAEAQKPYLVSTLARVSIPENTSDMLTLDNNDNLIYYDEGRGTISSLSIHGGETVSPTSLLDVKNATFTANIDGSIVTYKNMEIEQIFYDITANQLIITGIFRSSDSSDSDGWIDTSKPSTYQAAFILENGTLTLFCQQYPYFRSVMKDGRYLVSDYFFEDGQLQPRGDAYIWDAYMGTKTTFERISSVQMIVESENNFYTASWGGIDKYNFGTGRFEAVPVTINRGHYIWEASFTYNNGVFYYWTPEEVCAIRTNGQKKGLLDPNRDIEVQDMTPLPRFPENILVTSKEEIIFYDSSAKAVRIVYANPAVTH